jgi:carboxyl-terminal processing protease
VFKYTPMRLFRFPVFLSLFFVFWIACSKDNDTSTTTPTETDPPAIVSDIKEEPELLLGSWNLSQNTTVQKENASSPDCNAKNIHFLEDNLFYLEYLDKRIKGKYEIIDATSVRLLSGTSTIGTATKIEVVDNEIVLALDIAEECADTYTGARYYRIHEFVWKSLNEMYLWQEDVPNLSDNITVGGAKYNEIIAPYPEPEAFFKSLKHSDDKYSVIRSNYVDLENSIKGIDATNGVVFILSKYGSGDDILGVVSYILEGSDAEGKDIKRGDIFTGVDGQSLNLSNYQQLLFGDNLNYTLNMVDLSNNTLIPNGKNISLTKVENFQKNPIQISKIIENEGKKIGYLMYNQFAQGFDDDLNASFAEFKSQGIEELILDLRYNGGGLTRSALNLATMITGQYNGEVFAKYLWNKKLMTFLNANQPRYAAWLGENFTDQLEDGTPINSLNLSQVYIITTDRSASSSELVINGLSPYINVIQVGDNTYGKNVGGPGAIYDYIDNNQTKNPDHTYALYLMAFYSANSQDFYDYADGLAPQETLKLKEDLTQMGVLGEKTEPLLALALNHIAGNAARYKIKSPVFPLENTIDDTQFRRNLIITTVPDRKMPPLQLD